MLLSVLLLSTKYCASSRFTPDIPTTFQKNATSIGKRISKDGAGYAAVHIWNNSAVSGYCPAGKQQPVPAVAHTSGNNNIDNIASISPLSDLAKNNSVATGIKAILLFPMHCFL